MCSSSLNRQRREVLSSISSIQFASDLGRYLGFPLLNRRPKKNDFSFIIERLNQRLANFKGKLLNKAGKLTLAKSVLASIPIYLMQSFWLPGSICDEIDRVTRNFLWSKNNLERGMHLINWDTIARPMNEGGLVSDKLVW